MPQAFYILFGAAFTVAVSMAFGTLLLRRLSLKFHREEQLIFAFVAGAPCLSLLVFLLAAAGQARKGVFLGCGLPVIAIALWRCGNPLRGEPLPPLPRFWRRLFAAIFGVFTILYFFNAMAPEMSPDGSAYHLGIIARYLREHGFVRITTNMYANLSQATEMLFLFAFAFGRHSAAALVHFAFLLALPLAMFSYGRRFGFPAAGAAGALFTYVSPVVGLDGTTAYIDVAVACVLFVLFYLLQIWDRERAPGLLIPIGLLAGFGYAMKYTAFLAIPYAVGFVGWRLLRERKPALRPLAIVALCAAAMMVPWLAKNAIWLGNPVSPFFNAVFPNPYVQVAFEQEYARMMRNYEGLGSRWSIPLEVTVRGQVLCGLLGPLFLLAPVALAALRRSEGRRLLLAAAVFGSTYAMNIGTRFLIPAVPFLSLAMALALGAWDKIIAALALAHALLSWPNVLKLYCAQYAWRLDKVPVRQALRLEPEESYLSRKMPGYLVARMVEDNVPPGGVVLVFTPIAEAYTTREVRVVYQAASNARLGDALWMPLIPEFQPISQVRFRFSPEALRKVRVVQTAEGGPDQWSITEMRFFLGAMELERQPYWRLRAKPNPWDVQLAFDNSPITRWRSGEVLRPGMSVEVDFARPVTLDTVLLESSRDQYKVRLKLEAQQLSGEWRTLVEKPEEVEVAPPLGLRRAAVEELRAHRVGYLLLDDSDFIASDIRKNAVVWGVKLLGERNSARLYKLGD